ncbi:MAG TPA: choice-of-anchor A family protein, partial [Lacunisphaera sp.]|nr:choice-of-anchor A family protein [Lacunisphaera sp.]
TLLAFTLLAAARLAATPLGIGYDVFVEKDFNVSNGHIHGSSAVGGNLVLTGSKSEFASKSSSTEPGLVVAGQVDLSTDGFVFYPRAAQVGSLANGQAVVAYNQGKRLTQGNSSLEAKTIEVGAVGIDFTAAFDELALLSHSMASLAATVDLLTITTGDAQNKQLNLGFPTANPFNVLNLTYAEFANFKSISVDAPGTDAGSWIINVDLTGYNGSAITQNRNGSDDGADLILWNFFGANTLVLQNQFYGTVFAPELDFTHQNNDLKGQVIASSFTKLNGQVHIHRYEGGVPPPPAVPDTGSSLLLMAGALTTLVGLRARARR